VVVWPRLDLIVSGFFYIPGQGFFLAYNRYFNFLHHVAVRGAWILGYAFTALAVITFFARRLPLPPTKTWVFLLLALLIGPVLIANGVLKDHWGRARPFRVAEFGGASSFSPALEPQVKAYRNGSFVSGDGAFGFYLTALAYAVPLTRRRLSRTVFWSCIGAGMVFAFSRIVMGSHFFSDNLFAAFSMLLTNVALHAALFGKKVTREYWRAWLGLNPENPVDG
jgi:lipid A 4'-phosphatase